MNGKPTAAQKRFHDWCRERGCVICGGDASIHLHHIKGARMKLKGCVKPGEWFVLALNPTYHTGYHGVHTDKKGFVENYGTEKELWIKLISRYKFEFKEKPMSEEEYQIILERA